MWQLAVTQHQRSHVHRGKARQVKTASQAVGQHGPPERGERVQTRRRQRDAAHRPDPQQAQQHSQQGTTGELSQDDGHDQDRAGVQALPE